MIKIDSTPFLIISKESDSSFTFSQGGKKYLLHCSGIPPISTDNNNYNNDIMDIKLTDFDHIYTIRSN